jgi:hypothetical protein
MPDEQRQHDVTPALSEVCKKDRSDGLIVWRRLTGDSAPNGLIVNADDECALWCCDRSQRELGNMF